MTPLVDRRSFVHSVASLVAGYKLIPFRDSVTKRAAVASPQQSQAGRSYVCPPCGLDCDKLTFDKPGKCPEMRHEVDPYVGR